MNRLPWTLQAITLGQMSPR